MKVGIVTVYESITNLGSFLQAYALKSVLEAMGHEVYVIQNMSKWKSVRKCIMKINPKREFFLRIKKSKYFLDDMKKLKLLPKEKMQLEKLDCIIYGSDEIWNLDNPYFQEGLFWGEGAEKLSKIAYAVSMGAMSEETFQRYKKRRLDVCQFDKIMVRDEHTHTILKGCNIENIEEVCDPTLLLSLSKMKEDVKTPKEKYLLVYTYGVDKNMIDQIKKFAENEHLKIVSVCFWHSWADEVIECSALQFSRLISGAAYVFTSTFHGAIFTLLNHKQCCILPYREKVKDIVVKLGEEKYLISETCDQKAFKETMEQKFDSERFEIDLMKIKSESIEKLEGALQCLGK